MLPIISIIVPVYRVPEKYLRKCLNSCIEQTISNIEIIIVHDYAEDNCGEICDEFANLDSRVKVIHKREKINSGLSAARNTGVENAVGEWIMFVDGDDWIEPETCKYLLTATVNHNDIKLAMCAVCKDFGNRIEKYHTFEDDKILDRSELLSNVLNYNSRIATAYAKLIKRKHLIDNDIFHDPELKQGVEGIEFNIRLFNSIDKAVFVKQWLYHYMYNEESLSVNLTVRTNELLVLGYNKIECNIKEYQDKDILIALLYNRIQYSIVSGAIRCYFNKNVVMKKDDRIKKFEEFISDDLIKRALRYKSEQRLSFSRRMTLFFIRHKMYCCVSLISKIRLAQLNNKNKTG